MTRTAQLRLDLVNNNSPITSEISRQVDSDRHKHDKSSTQIYAETKQTTAGDKSSVKTTDGRRSSDFPRGSQGKTLTSHRYGQNRSVTGDGRNHQMKSMTQQRSKSVATNSRLPRPDKVSSRLSTASYAPVSSSVKKHNPKQSHAELSSTAKKETRTLVPDPKDQKMDQSDIKR